MLALDIGIKHLAYCVAASAAASEPRAAGLIDLSGNLPLIRHWSLVNLTDLEDTAKPVCYQCQKPAKAKAPRGLVCGRHMPKDAPQIFDEATGKPIKRLPTIAQMQTFLKARGLDPKGKREELFQKINASATMPLEKKKSAASFADNTCNLHDAIRGWIARDWQHLQGVTSVYIEHQPVYKNPVMKTVQILIFASLREQYMRMNPAGVRTDFHFVHAGKKVKGAEVGDGGYKDRKAGGEARTRDYLQKFPIVSKQQDWLRWWQRQPKKDDLADTLCMILDAA